MRSGDAEDVSGLFWMGDFWFGGSPAQRGPSPLKRPSRARAGLSGA